MTFLKEKKMVAFYSSFLIIVVSVILIISFFDLITIQKRSLQFYKIN